MGYFGNKQMQTKIEMLYNFDLVFGFVVFVIIDLSDFSILSSYLIYIYIFFFQIYLL
jgi:hypothetical protein